MNRIVTKSEATLECSILTRKQIEASRQLAQLLFSPEKPKRYTIRVTQDVFDYCIQPNESIHCHHSILIGLNTKNQIITEERIERSVSSDLFDFNKFVFRHLIIRNCASAILVHFQHDLHLEPTQQQIKTVQQLYRNGSVVGISLLDCILITNGNFFSFKNRGLI
ncbi:JAB domain-containing protein [Brevibacillus reuszeri]|uniref:JAB domain-containing protein n=1 Tax=Brevibacillus reuszeri TaxID=54915 RepID=UPI003D24C3ED